MNWVICFDPSPGVKKAVLDRIEVRPITTLVILHCGDLCIDKLAPLVHCQSRSSPRSSATLASSFRLLIVCISV
ncbi:hypothetical protein KAT59_02200 [Candidatus Bipolaricaulota bacterium]|nr:hypothetical protein [Candidatus Bipolaricaulota bacterium]